jgi:SAM-dependent methyltransferase
MRFTFTFICQRGALEAKAVLLAASLRRHLAASAELVACLPMPEAVWGRPSRHTLRAFESLGVVTAPVRNLIAETYPIGNKIACLDVPAAMRGLQPDRVVFLDSDILCTAPFDADLELAGDFSVKPVDFATFVGGPAAWSRLYRLFGLAEPGRRVVATVSGEETWPYFNAGVIGARADAGLARSWAECCRRIDAEEWVPSRRPHLDQIALPIAAALCGLDFTPLDERLNYPAHLRPLRPAPPVLCHYHRPDIVAQEPSLTGAVRGLVDASPALRPVLQADPAWRPILGAPRRRWWSIGLPQAAPDPSAAAPAANDVTAEALTEALERSPTPDLLQTVVDVSRRRFGWFTRHPSRAFEYPWVVARLSGRRGGSVIDIGAGVSPVPLLLALYGVQVTTVDDSDVVRDPAAGMTGWDEWGFLDYAKLDPAISSVQGDAADLDLPPGSCAAAYSISVVEHMPAATRRRLWPRLAGWLEPGGALVLTVDLMPGTDHLWNRASGHEVEPVDQHGDLPALIAELGGLGFRLDGRTDLRGLPGMRADVALLAFTKGDEPPGGAA